MRMISIGLAAALLAFSSAAALAAETFKLETYFKGRTTAEGSFSAINGVKRNFKVKLDGKWNGRVLTLVENFTYADGERDRKTWRFTKQPDGTYRGTREDVIGETIVRIRDNVATFNYEVYLDGAARKNRVHFYDRMQLNPDGTMLNTATVTKFGILPVARTHIAFRRGT